MAVGGLIVFGRHKRDRIVGFGIRVRTFVVFALQPVTFGYIDDNHGE